MSGLFVSGALHGSATAGTPRAVRTGISDDNGDAGASKVPRASSHCGAPGASHGGAPGASHGGALLSSLGASTRGIIAIGIDQGGASGASHGGASEASHGGAHPVTVVASSPLGNGSSGSGSGSGDGEVDVVNIPPVDFVTSEH